MKDNISYPTQGELLKFVFDITGILPNNEQTKSEDCFAQEKDRIQTSLRRLSKEEGEFCKNFQDNAHLLQEKLNKHIPDEYLASSFCDSLFDLFQCYMYTINYEGTFRDKKTSIQYLIERAFMPRLIISIFKYRYSYQDYFKVMQHPAEKFWFLADDDLSPLELIMDWIYKSTNKTKTEFHCPTNSDDNFNESRDLENARNWRKKRNLPQLKNLLDNFQRGMKAHDIDVIKQQQVTSYLFLGRLANAILKALQENYGKAWVDQLCEHFKQQFDMLERDYLACKEGVLSDFESLIKQKDNEFSIEQNHEMLNRRMVKKYLENYEDLSLEIAKIQQETRININDIPEHDFLNMNLLDQLVITQQRYALNTLDQYKPSTKERSAIENMVIGYNILTGKEPLTENWLSQHEISGASNMFPWLGSWVLGREELVKNNYQAAQKLLKQSFSLMKYSASQQYRFLDDYLVACGQANQWQDFKKAISWARYMDHFGYWHGKVDIELKDEKAFEQCKNYFVYRDGISRCKSEHS